jgi:hypothetical protein
MVSTKPNKTKTMSKTKAKAIRNKPATVSVIKAHGGSPKEVLLAKMMEQHVVGNDSVSFEDILSGLGMNNRNTTWRNVWRDLLKDGHTEANNVDGPVFTSGYRLTDSGLGNASTEEYQKTLAAVVQQQPQPKTEQELHQSIKSKLMNQRGEQIFDLLLQQGPQSRKELAKLLGISDTGAYFSYALQQLKDLGYAENVKVNGSRTAKVRLTVKAFLSDESEAFLLHK